LATNEVGESVAFLVFSDDYGEHPSSCQHLFQHISKNHQVLWVNTIGMRNPNLTMRDISKIFTKVGGMLRSLLGGRNRSEAGNFDSLVDSNITVCQPFMLPYANIGIFRALNRISVTRHVNNKLTQLKLDQPVMVVTAPNACDYIGAFAESRVVYYCVDEFSEWPGVQRELVTSMESQLLHQCDVFVATSTKLLNKFDRHGEISLLLTHGVDAKLFADSTLSEHGLLADIPKPRVGYFGLFDDRSDQDLLYEVATKMPDVSFVITGSTETDVSRLASLGNMYFTGSVPFLEVTKIAAGFDICMLPYKLNDLTDAIQPLKFKEYIATGKPIVSTPIKEARGLADYIGLAATADEWTALIRRNLDGYHPTSDAQRHSFLHDESWASKAERFLDHCLR